MIHLLPEEGVMAFRDLNAQRYFPVHWGMFTLALHSWFEPIETISRLAEQEGFPLVAPVIGQLVDVSSDTHFPRWWERRLGRRNLYVMLPNSNYLTTGSPAIQPQ